MLTSRAPSRGIEPHPVHGFPRNRTELSRPGFPQESNLRIREVPLPGIQQPDALEVGSRAPPPSPQPPRRRVLDGWWRGGWGRFGIRSEVTLLPSHGPSGSSHPRGPHRDPAQGGRVPSASCQRRSQGLTCHRMTHRYLNASSSVSPRWPSLLRRSTPFSRRGSAIIFQPPVEDSNLDSPSGGR